MLTTLLTSAVVLLASMLFALFVIVWRILVFRRELKRIRLVLDTDDAAVSASGSGDLVGDLRHARGLLTSAQGPLHTALARARWEIIGLGNPVIREMELLGAAADLQEAKIVAQEAALHLRGVDLELGHVVPAFQDPVTTLAVRGRWFMWAALVILPRPFRAAYSYRSLRSQVLELRISAQELEEAVGTALKTVEPAPPRRVGLRNRIPVVA